MTNELTRPPGTFAVTGHNKAITHNHDKEAAHNCSQQIAGVCGMNGGIR